MKVLTEVGVRVQEAMLQLWCHETLRIIGDRMWDPADRAWLKGQLDDKLKAIFGTSWDDLFGEGKDCPPFVSFMRNTENPPYEPVTDAAALKVCHVKRDCTEQQRASHGSDVHQCKHAAQKENILRMIQCIYTHLCTTVQLGRQIYETCPELVSSWSLSPFQQTCSYSEAHQIAPSMV